MPISKKKNLAFYSFPKLIREIPLFWNSIFGQSSYNKLKIKKKKKIIEPYSGVLRSLIGTFLDPIAAFCNSSLSLIAPYL